MSEKLLREFVRLSMHESPLARVPTQLLEPDETTGKAKKGDCGCDAKEGEACSCDDREDEMDEMGIGVGGGAMASSGAIAGGPAVGLGSKRRKKK
jgi:hypothetical protein